MAGDTLVQAGTVGGTHLTAQQVDDGRGSVEGDVGAFRILLTHAQPVVAAGTEHLHVGVVGHVLRYVDKHVAAVLQLVARAVVGIALTGTIDLVHHIILITIGRPEVHKGIRHVGLGIAGLGGAVSIEKLPEIVVGIVVGTIAAAKDGIGTPLQVLHVGRSRSSPISPIGPITLILRKLRNPAREVPRAIDGAAQVVAAIHNIANPGEALHIVARSINAATTYVGLGMSEDVGVTRAGEAVEDAALAQVDDGIAADGTLEAAAVDELRLGHVLAAVGLLRHTNLRTFHVHGAGVGIAVGIRLAVEVIGPILIGPIGPISPIGLIGPIGPIGLSNNPLCAAAEYLEGIAAVQVDGGRTPYLGVLTIAAAEHAEGLAKHVHTLLTQDDARLALGDVVGGRGGLVLAIEAYFIA